MHTDVYVCILVYVCICMHVYVCMYMYVCICMCVCMYVCMYECMYVCVCVYVCIYVCVHNILGWELSRGNVLPKTGGGIVRGDCPGWNCPGGIVLHPSDCPRLSLL